MTGLRSAAVKHDYDPYVTDVKYSAVDKKTADDTGC